MRIYVFGNPLVKEDSLPLKILPKLKKLSPKIIFEIADPNENFPPNGEKNIIILDTVKGIKKPSLLDLNHLERISKTPNSPHDYDLMFHLQLLKKLKKIEGVKIIGIPSWVDRPKMVNKLIVNELKVIITTLLLGSVRRRTYRGQRRG